MNAGGRVRLFVAVNTMGPARRTLNKHIQMQDARGVQKRLGYRVVVEGTSVVAQTPGGYGNSGAPVPATPNPGFTSTVSSSHPHSRTTLTGTAGPTSTVEAGAGAVSGSLFAVVLALGVAIA